MQNIPEMNNIIEKKNSSLGRRLFLRHLSMYAAGCVALPAVLLSLTGCKKDFLNQDPLDAITDDAFWKTDEQLKLAVNACYIGLRGKPTIDLENMGDNTIYPSTADYLAISTGRYDFSLPTLNTEWVNQYTNIRRCNHFLENYQRATTVTKASLNQYVGEVRFLRAYMYSYLAFFYGDTPLVTKTLTIGDPELTAPRNPVKDVVDWIIKELDDAAGLLSPTYTSTDLGRITRGAALGWKAKVALHYGRYAVAESAASAVMALGIYQLYNTGTTATSYNNLFKYTGKLANGNNKETLLARLYLANVSLHNMSREAQVPDQTSRFSPTKSLVDSYLCTDGKPITMSPLYSEASYADIFKNRDPRMAQTVLSPGSAWGGKADGISNGTTLIYNSPKFNADKKGSVTSTGYYFTKYVELSTVDLVTQDSNDIHLLRYAEILLIYAEAKLEQGTLTQADIDKSINLLRRRVGMIDMKITDIAAWGGDLRTEIRRERRVELALEGQRWFDIVRWKQGALLALDVKGMKKSLIPAANQAYVNALPTDANGYLIINTSRIFADRNYLWPVPVTQLQKNPALGQNPGW